MLLIFGPFMCTRLMDGRCLLITGFVFTAVIAREVELFFPRVVSGPWTHSVWVYVFRSLAHFSMV